VVALGTAGVATVAGGVVTGTTTLAPGLGALSAKGLVTKLLTVVAVAGGTGDVRHSTPQAVAGTPPVSALYRSHVIALPSGALTVRRDHASKPSVHGAPTSPSAGGPADPPAPLTVPAPDPAHADVTPSPAATAAPQHPSTQPAAAPAPAAISTPAVDPAPTPAAATPDPDPATTTTDPAASAPTTETEPAASTASTPAVAPAATTTAEPDPSPPASTLSTTEDPPAGSTPTAAAAEAQG
jgi:hypothetical protein